MLTDEAESALAGSRHAKGSVYVEKLLSL